MSYPSWVKTSIEMFLVFTKRGIKGVTNCAEFTMQHRHALAMLQLVAVHKVLEIAALFHHLSTDGCRMPAYAW